MLHKLLFRPLRLFSESKHLPSTIFALSSGLNTAISIIRISGPNARHALQLIKEKTATKVLQTPRYMQFAKLYNSHNQIIDQGMIVYFPSSMSYNKEDMIELHLHGSKAVVDAVFTQLKKLNMRMAQRGQITKRAVVNGKLSLNQAQAINDLIHSYNQFTRQVSINNLLGKNMNYLEQLKEDLVKSLAKCQAYIDFNEDQVTYILNSRQTDVKETLFDDTKASVKANVIPKVQNLLKNYKNLKIMKDGVNIVIVGKPNVGKSTLINLMSNKNVSIVNSKAGTTRDVIQTSIQLQGFRLNLIDTAGLRLSQCQIQNQGVQRAKQFCEVCRQKIKESHVKLLLVDVGQEEKCFEKVTNTLDISLDVTDQYIGEVFRDESSFIIVNKIDLLSQQFNLAQISISSISPLTKQKITRKPTIIMSAGVQKNPQTLFNLLSQKLKKQYSCFLNPNQIFFTRQRYFNHLEICLEKLELYVQQDQVDFACQYLRQAINEVQQIFGRVDSEDVLDVLFRDFCIGK